jgi:hypothetical protein
MSCTILPHNSRYTKREPHAAGDEPERPISVPTRRDEDALGKGRYWGVRQSRFAVENASGPLTVSDRVEPKLGQ